LLLDGRERLQPNAWSTPPRRGAKARPVVSEATKILVIEDDEQLLRLLEAALTHAGYVAQTARSASDAAPHLDDPQVRVVLLDLGLPDVDGMMVIDQIRQSRSVPIIVLSARDSEGEKIAALDRGANDFMQKPFDMGELLARIRVALRMPTVRTEAPVRTARLELHFAERRAVVNGQTKRLSRKETELLRLLWDANGAVVDHHTIITALWGPGADADLAHIRVLTWQARKKIEPDPRTPRFIIAEPGVGYRLIRG
jgi:two-component system KDP operon response regulator KdpE